MSSRGWRGLTLPGEEPVMIAERAEQKAPIAVLAVTPATVVDSSGKGRARGTSSEHYTEGM
jgi:hypothetical protein